ncbi:hypothetical protein AJ88_37305 [Mesorhizobium amorphae CCBAU 01583]|nr:hypothetical protein AJ88_37305 [Mesorhizobium amorphae CCBAU 01583]
MTLAKGRDGEAASLLVLSSYTTRGNQAQWQQSIAFPPDKTFANAPKKLVTRGAGRQRDVTRDANPDMIIALG